MMAKPFTITSAPVDAHIWRMPLWALAIVFASILAMLHRDVADMVTIWWTSSTFNHCLLIVPILVWLVRTRAKSLIHIVPQPYWPGLLWSLCGALLWMLGDAAGVGFARQVALIMMLQSAVIAILGAQVARGLIFPLGFAFFLVPFGEDLVPILQTFTAKLSMVMLGWCNIAAHINGVFISTPNGYFEVAEACSGAKFLIAMSAYSVLVAHVCFRSVKRRAVFLAGALITPVLANGVRAFSTIWVAEHYGRNTAIGVDHVVYGWVFFGIVIAAVMAVAWRWFDRSPNDGFVDVALLNPARGGRIGLRAAALVLVAILAVPMAWSYWTFSQASTRAVTVNLPDVAGWQRADNVAQTPWKPRFDGADAVGIGHYRNAAGQQVDMAIAAFAAQSEGRELVGFGQGAIDPDSLWAWSSAGPEIAGVNAGKARWDRMSAPGPVQREAIIFYRIGSVITGRPTTVKLATLKSRLFGADQSASAFIISAQSRPNAPAEAAMRAFVKDMGAAELVMSRAVIIR
jgi:exosortase A